METRTKEEQQKEYMRIYREKNREKFREYDRKRWNESRGELERIKAMAGKKCRSCEILLSSQYGGFGTKFYCRGCVESGDARQHTCRTATQRWRRKKLPRKKNAV